MNIYFIGHPGSDAGGWYIGSDGKIHRVPGWGVEARADLEHALTVLREASQIKAPGVAEATIKGALELVHKEMETYVKGGGVVVL